MADLIGQIAAGGAGVPLANALEQFKSGVQFATEQHAAGQKSKLADIAIQQGQKDLVAQDQINEKRAIELDQMKKSQPLWDKQLDMDMKKMAHAAEIEPLQFQYAYGKITSDLAALPVEEHVQHLQSMHQFLTSVMGDEKTYTKAMTDPEMEDMRKEFDLTGDLKKDRGMIKAIAAATLATPQIQSQLINKQAAVESAQAVERMRVQGQRDVAQINAASRERVALIKQDTDLEKAATRMAGSKTLDVKKEDVIVAKTLLAADPYFSQFKGDQLNALSQQFATIKKSYLQTGAAKGVTVEDAQNLAYDKLKGLTEAVNPDNRGLMDTIKSALHGKNVPSPGGKSEAAPTTQRFEVGGKVYNIPADKVAAFKKAKGIQ